MSNFQQGFALIVGIGNDLPMTVDDAQIVYDVLADPKKAAYPKENIQLVTGKNATRKNIEAAFDKLIAQSKNVPGSTVVVYYSGHGAQVPWTDGKPHYFLIPNDAKFDDLDTLMPAEIFTQKVNAIESDKLLVILDCCHAEGQHAEGDPISKSVTSKAPLDNSNQKLLGALKDGEGKIFIASCKDNELSYIGKGDTNSLFTKHLVRALNGQNSSFYDFVHVVDVIQYLFRMVPQEAKAVLKVSQTPIINYADKLDAEFFICANNQGAEKGVKIASDVIKKETADIDAEFDNFLKSNPNSVIKNEVRDNTINIGTGNMNVAGTINNIVHNYYGTNPSNSDPASKDTNIDAGDSKAYLKEAKKLIGNEKIEKALDLLMDNVDDDHTDMIIMQKARWKGITNKLNMGLIMPNQAMITQNQIRNALLAIISDIKDS